MSDNIFTKAIEIGFVLFIVLVFGGFLYSLLAPLVLGLIASYFWLITLCGLAMLLLGVVFGAFAMKQFTERQVIEPLFIVLWVVFGSLGLGMVSGDLMIFGFFFFVALVFMGLLVVLGSDNMRLS